jgi:hypothetical protein
MSISTGGLLLSSFLMAIFATLELAGAGVTVVEDLIGDDGGVIVAALEHFTGDV